MRVNYTRRVVGLGVAFAPSAVLVASLVWSLIRGSAHHPYALSVMLLALIIGGINLHLSVVRPLLFVRARGSGERYRHVSGIPIVGTLAVLVGSVLGFGSAPCAAVGLVAVAIDTGGSVWFLVATWRDPSFWDERPERGDLHRVRHRRRDRNRERLGGAAEAAIRGLSRRRRRGRGDPQVGAAVSVLLPDASTEHTRQLARAALLRSLGSRRSPPAKR